MFLSRCALLRSAVSSRSAQINFLQINNLILYALRKLYFMTQIQISVTVHKFFAKVNFLQIRNLNDVNLFTHILSPLSTQVRTHQPNIVQSSNTYKY